VKRAPEPHDDDTRTRGKQSRWLRRWWLWAGAVVVIAGAVAGVYAWSQYHTLTSAKYSVISYDLPAAPHLTAASGETVYRIDPSKSDVGYAIHEKLLGHAAHTAKGVTNGIAGDIALNRNNTAASRVGTIVVNVEQLHSDNNLRDAKMRQGNLDSHDYPLARLSNVKLAALPSHLRDGTKYHFTLSSTLTVHARPRPVDWDVDASVANGKLVADATARVKLSTWNIGPISVAGLVSTSDDATLTMHLTALDPSKYQIPSAIAAPETAKRPKTNVSFARDIKPLLQANCAACHQPGEIGAPHWKLATAGDAASVSDGIGTVVDSKYMPPWPASNKGVALAHSRALNQRAIDEIVSWSKAGGPLDVPADTKITPTKGPVGPPPRRDVTLMMPQAYTGSLAKPNDYRCFVLNPHLTSLTYVTGFQVTPHQREEIHHVQIFHISAAQVKIAQQVSGKDGKPGWSCYGSLSLPPTPRSERDRDPNSPRAQARRRIHGFTGQDDLFAGWVPGQDPVTFPKNLGVPFAPGDAIVFQVHYHYSGTPLPDRSSVALQLDKPTPAFKPVDIINPIAPVEIPCLPSQANAPLCNRANALKDDARLYGPIGAAAEWGLLFLCHQTSDSLAANFHDGVASTTCDYKVPETGKIIAVFGHEHTLGKSFRFTLDPGKPTEKILLDIPSWNFDWQMNYPLAKPLHVTEGQTIRMQCSWDRSLDPNRSPKYIVFAEGTEDEMCFGTYAIVPDRP
jgi:polyisoprenoid-binding protein YceI/mono/diheme cytochrome c family protein